MLDERESTPRAQNWPSGRLGGRVIFTGRRAIAWIAAGLAVVLLAAAVGLPIYVFPPTDRPAKADAVLVLGPSSTARITEAWRLVDEGYAAHVYISTPNPERASTSCTAPHTGCFAPRPTTTRGEALFALEQARAHGWSKVIVVTGDSHISRARFIFDRCSGVDALMVGVHERRTLFAWGYQYVYQTAGFVKALIVGCARPASKT